MLLVVHRDPRGFLDEGLGVSAASTEPEAEPAEGSVRASAPKHDAPIRNSEAHNHVVGDELSQGRLNDLVMAAGGAVSAAYVVHSEDLGAQPSRVEAARGPKTSNKRNAALDDPRPRFARNTCSWAHGLESVCSVIDELSYRQTTGAACCGSDDAACVAPWPRSAGFARG